MIRTYDARGIRTVPADERYPGMTALRLDDARELVAVGTGPEVERVLLSAAGKRVAEPLHNQA